jgi:hypothetical protein
MKIYLTITTDNGAAFYSGLSALQDGRHITAYTILNEDAVPMHDSDTIDEGVHTALIGLNTAIAAYEDALRVHRTHQLAATLWTNVEL